MFSLSNARQVFYIFITNILRHFINVYKKNSVWHFPIHEWVDVAITRAVGYHGNGVRQVAGADLAGAGRRVREVVQLLAGQAHHQRTLHHSHGGRHTLLPQHLSFSHATKHLYRDWFIVY